MEKSINCCFLAANSYNGFVSKFKNNYFPELGYKVYIIKGGPGTGKSSFMKSIAAAAINAGKDVTLCPCSSDPDSLDGVIIKDTKTVFFDGTSPHTVDPDYPGVCENIIDLGQFWDKKKLMKNRLEIISATNINGAFHKTASRYLSACKELKCDNVRVAKKYTDTEKVLKYAKGVCDKYIPDKKGKYGFEQIRFAGGITPLGIVTFPESIIKDAEKVIIINDNIGTISGIILESIRKHALFSGYEIITYRNPFLPKELCDHIVIPELKFAIATESKHFKFPKENLRIYSRRFYNKGKTAEKARISFNNKVERELLSSAIDVLSKAKASHDILEKYYIDAMDFDALNSYKESFINNFLL